jgi:predicted ATP-dependent endonuclease of OLD family
MSDLKTYSVLLNWQDGDPEQGTFGATVRARDEDEAERLARREMAAMHRNELGEYAPAEDEDDEDYVGGSVLEISEGAIWQAQKLEDALRDIVAASDANDGGSLANAIEAARSLLAGLWSDPE